MTSRTEVDREFTQAQLVWTYTFEFQDRPCERPNVVWWWREDAIAAAEAAWRTHCEEENKRQLRLGLKVIPMLGLAWERAHTDTDYTVAYPLPALTVSVVPMRVDGGLLLGPGDARQVGIVLAAATIEGEAALETDGSVQPHDRAAMTDSVTWAHGIMNRIRWVLERR